MAWKGGGGLPHKNLLVIILICHFLATYRCWCWQQFLGMPSSSFIFFYISFIIVIRHNKLGLEESFFNVMRWGNATIIVKLSGPATQGCRRWCQWKSYKYIWKCLISITFLFCYSRYMNAKFCFDHIFVKTHFKTGCHLLLHFNAFFISTTVLPRIYSSLQSENATSLIPFYPS